MPLSLSPTTKGKEVAAVHNHLLSFSVLAILNAHHPAAFSHTNIELSSQDLTLNDLHENEFGSMIFKDWTGDARLSMNKPVEFTFNRETKQPSDNQSDDWFEMAFLSQKSGQLIVDKAQPITFKAQNVNAVTALSTENFLGFDSNTQALNLNLAAKSQSNTLDYAVTWAITDSDWNTPATTGQPKELKLALHTDGLSDGATAAALLLTDSTFGYQGRLILTAIDAQDRENVHALELWSSRFHFESQGQSVIRGNILVDGASELHLGLNRDGDLFEGRIIREISGDSLNATLVLSSGARWSTYGHNQLNSWQWGQNGILDLSQCQETAFIKNDANGALTETQLEDGARLIISITDQDSANSGYKLELGQVRPISSDGSRVFVEIIDKRTNKTDGELDIGLIKVDDVDDAHSKFFAESVPSYYENALGSYRTYGSIGTDGQDGFKLTGITTQRLGPSNLVKSLLDFSAALTIAHEQNADRVFSAVSDRLSQRKERGLWVHAQTQETELHLQRLTRDQTLKTHSLTLGYDTDIKLPFLNNGSVGLWGSVNQTENDFTDGDGDLDEKALGVYFHGLTDENYRLILFGHYGWAENSLDTEGFFSAGNKKQKVRYNMDSQVYGAGLYFGFAYPDLPNGWFFEPFVSGYTYWIDPQKSNRFEGVSFENEKIHQSLTKIGVTGGKSLKAGAGSLALYAQAAWVHRFAQSHDLTGYENERAETFETEDLQESWGYLKFSGHWQLSPATSVGANVSVFTSKVVEPQYELGLKATYEF